MKRLICDLILIAMCGLHGTICTMDGIGLTDWKFWVLLVCIFIAYLCGIRNGTSKD